MITAMQENWTFDLLHKHLLDFFVSRRLFDQLRWERYERLQRDNEPSAVYVTSIKEAAVLLKLQVNNVIEGLAPEQRSRFVFQRLPACFADQLRQIF
jgi:hypothetical protein